MSFIGAGRGRAARLPRFHLVGFASLAAVIGFAACSDSNPGESPNAAGEGGETAGTSPASGTHAGGGGTHTGGSGITAGTSGSTVAGEGQILGGASGAMNGSAAGERAAGDGGASPGAAGAAGSDTGPAGFTWPVTTRPTWDGTLPTTGVCSVNRFCWNLPYRTDNDLYAVWASSPTNVWVAGSAATLARYDGSAWSGVTAIEDPEGTELFGFHLLRGTAGSTSNVWAVGWATGTPNDQIFYRFDGSKWTKMTAPILPVNDIWATGANELWTADQGGYVSHWDGTQWHDLHAAQSDVTAIYGFSDSDVWIVAETVLRYNGTSWSDKGSASGASIWGATSGDMWTGAGQHLVGGVWQQKTGAGTGFKKVIGASATDLIFLGRGNNPYTYYLKGATFAPSNFDSTNATDAWPVSATDYWVTGKTNSPSPTNLIHGDPSGTPKVFSEHGGGVPSDTGLPAYKTIGKALMKLEGADYVPLKSFDSSFSGGKELAWNDTELWVVNGGQLWKYTNSVWTTVPVAVGCAAGLVQLDGDGHLWTTSFTSVSLQVCVYDGATWTPLDVRASNGNAILPANLDDWVVQGHEAWLREQLVAYRFNGSKWDTYALGIDPAVGSGTSISISTDGQVYIGDPLSPRLVFRP